MASGMVAARAKGSGQSTEKWFWSEGQKSQVTSLPQCRALASDLVRAEPSHQSKAKDQLPGCAAPLYVSLRRDRREATKQQMQSLRYPGKGSSELITIIKLF